MTVLYGPTFGDDVIAAGLGGLPFSWSETEIYGRENLTAEQNASLDAVIAAHDPTEQLPPPPPVVDANGRLDAGIVAALVAAENVRDGLHAMPTNFNAANFQQFLLQAKILSDAFVAMLQAQAAPVLPPSPP